MRKKNHKEGKKEIKKEINALSKEIKQRINKYNNDQWYRKLSKLTIKDNSLWKMTKALTKNDNNSIPPLHGERGIVFSTPEKAEALAENCEKVHHLTENLGNEKLEKEAKEKYYEVKNSAVNFDEIKYVSPYEIKKAMSKMKPRKAPGHEGIQNIVLKNLPFKALVLLTNIFNACLRLSYFPETWKKANVLAFPKPGKDKKFPQNYRPISLLTTLSKLLEKILLNRILEFEAINKILINEQFGFRKNKSTVQQLARITDKICNNFNINRHTAMLLLDIEKAFDTVWHRGLIYKLDRYKFPKYIIKIIISYLYKRKFKINIQNIFSKEYVIVAGVPQGSILGPILFLLYINDFPRGINTTIAFFADDTALIADSWRKMYAIKYLQRHIEDLEKYYNDWKIKINVNKTELVIFSQRTRKEKLTELKMNDVKISIKDEAKYLGVTLDNKLKFTQHIKNIIQKANMSISKLYCLINRKSNLSLQNKLIIYKMIIRPTLLYASPIWSNTSKRNIESLEKVQNKVIRMITNAQRYKSNAKIRDELKITSISEEIAKNASKFYKIQIKNNPLLQNVATFTKETAPFKIKFKLPHQILLNK